MDSLSSTATQTFEQLVRGLDVGEARKIGTGKGFTPVSVERLTEDLYSVAHYYEQNGDLIADPDMEVWRDAHGHLYPIAIQHPHRYQRVVEFGDKHRPLYVDRRAQRDLVGFAAFWLRNIRQQQREWFAKQGTADHG